MAKKYSREHEWIDVDGTTGTVGISNHAQEQLGDVVFVELPKIGAEATKGGQIAVVESVKAASEIYAPVAGTVIEVNGVLENSPELVNQSAEDKGWFFKLTIKDKAELDGLMDEAAYKAFAASGE